VKVSPSRASVSFELALVLLVDRAHRLGVDAQFVARLDQLAHVERARAVLGVAFDRPLQQLLELDPAERARGGGGRHGALIM
jgi:hypothetical protein